MCCLESKLSFLEEELRDCYNKQEALESMLVKDNKFNPKKQIESDINNFIQDKKLKLMRNNSKEMLDPIS